LAALVELGIFDSGSRCNQQNDARVHMRNGERRVRGDGKFELRECIFAALLVHVGDAEIVGADGAGDARGNVGRVSGRVC
jgi:hypothetical protein